MLVTFFAASMVFMQPSVIAQPSSQSLAQPTATVAQPVAATIGAAGFLEGSWSETKPSQRGGNELTQEVWTAPAGNNMMGMFRWLNGAGKSIVFELLTITEEENTLVLRLRHQSANGVAWEEREEPATFILQERTDTKLNFVDVNNTCDLVACVYECPTAKTLKITVKFDDTSRADLVFNLAK